ncbi:MAG: acetate--CoA ligase family protein [Acidimicrobiales bacterium]
MTVLGDSVPSRHLEAFFCPRRVAVIGASRHDGKLGNTALRSSAALGFGGQMYGVNTHDSGGEVYGWPMVSSLAEIGEEVDLALVAVPAASTPPVVADCARAGVRACVLVASGLGETGDLSEHEMGSVAAAAGTRLVGPNGFGIFVADLGLNLTAWAAIPAGRIALLTQSGNVAIALFRQAAHAGIGFSSVVGLGNQLDVSFAELVEYHALSGRCDAVALYLEGLRPGAGRALRQAMLTCRQAHKPLVVIKAGRSRSASVAVRSHTGALSGNDQVWEAVLSETGAVRAGSTEEMVDALCAVTALARMPSRALVLTDGGGDSVMALDALRAAGIPLARLGRSTETALDAMTPPAAPRVGGRNPVTLDTAGGLEEDPALIARCAEAGALDEGVDVVVVSGGFGGYSSKSDRQMAGVEQLLALKTRGIRIVVHSAFAADGEESLRRLREGGIPVYPTIQRLAAALAVVARGGVEVPESAPVRAEQELLSIEDTASRLRSMGIDLPPFAVASDATQLMSAAEGIGFPVCLKIEHPQVAHKSDVGGVRLDIGPGELLEAAAAIWEGFPDARIVVMAMLRPGLELLVGTSFDATFGPVVAVGRGGVAAELDPDVQLLLAPATVEEAVSAWMSLRCSPLLRGWRGAAGLDIDALASLTASISRLAAKGAAFECNPVFAYEKGYAIADMRAVLEP